LSSGAASASARPEPAPDPVAGSRLFVSGVVQGVGFRPFVYGLARGLDLTGWVRNTSAGVEILIEGPPQRLDAFVDALRHQAPPLSRIHDLRREPCAVAGHGAFLIEPSATIAGAFQPLPPDVAVCHACLAEVRRPADRRHRYPFTNCTDCGPRFTIIVDLPYDRPNTTMAAFQLCPRCEAEYRDPADRRFHAQPVACPDCGPSVWLEPVAGEVTATATATATARGDAALREARRLLVAGRIVAVKGLGGFHLACNARDGAAVERLRERKAREAKPLAVMLPDLAAVERHCDLGPRERDLLVSSAAPIVLLPRRAGSDLAPAVAPDVAELGVMLPYTPLHHLLLQPDDGDGGLALVMTSGNASEEPIATDNDDARRRLGAMCDAFLMHDRPIRTRCDDSVARVVMGRPYFLRRSRGYAPYPVALPFGAPQILAAGAELKNVFALTRGEQAFLSHHIGDMENYETLQAFEDGVRHLERLFRARVEAVAHDLHPDYLATRYAAERALRDGLPALAVQHHHAHVAACMADNGLAGDRPVLGVAFDGTGLGPDGTVWGGELLVATYEAFERRFHLDRVPLPGGDRAAREPWRVALSWLAAAGVPWESDLPPVAAALSEEALRVLRRQLETGINAPLTSSAGRLFDAVASLAGLHQRARYEAQAAMALEAVVDPDETGAYELAVTATTIDPRPAVRAVVSDGRAGVAVGRVAARFHNGLARAVREACRIAGREAAARDVALGGGVWQNTALLERTARGLESDGFRVLLHRQVPANDGGLALGQACVAGAWLRAGRAMGADGAAAAGPTQERRNDHVLGSAG